MFYRIFLGVGLTALTLLSSVSTPVMAGEIESEIMQYRLGRFYFASGREARVFPESKFTIYCGTDSLFSGIIRHSYSGVSISDSNNLQLDTLTLDSCCGIIETADVDSISNIRVVVDSLVTSVSSWIILGRTTGCGNYVRTTSSNLYSWHGQGIPDGFLSYVDDPRRRGYRNKITFPAPIIAVMIPNIGSELNRDGFLSTSLYYRFNDSTLSRYFNGSPVAPQHTLYITSDITKRFYPFDPARGRGLAGNIVSDRRAVRIERGSGLRNLWYYFVDVLSRDKFVSPYGTRGQPVDIYLSLVPAIQSEPVEGLSYIVALLKRHKPASKTMKEQLEIIDQRISAARSAKDMEAKLYYCELIDRSLKEDFGVFPLFRPYVTFFYSDQLEGCRFDEDGRLVVEEMTLLKLPEADRNQSQ